MTTTTLNPQVLGQAENAHRAILERILAGTGTGTAYRHWVTIKVIAVGGGAVDRGPLLGRLTGALKIDPAAVLATIDELTGSGLLETLPGEQPRLALTEAGQALHDQVSAAVGEIIGRLYRDLPADDLATAGRVLSIITARANAELAA